MTQATDGTRHDGPSVPGIDFSDHEGFWRRPLAERWEAYARLRREAPVSYQIGRAHV